MVAQYEDPAPGAVVEDVVTPVEPASGPDTPEDAAPSPKPEPDPSIAALADELKALQAKGSRADTAIARVESAAGRIEFLQSEVDRLRNADPLADIDPRISANEGVAAAVAQILLGSDLIDDSVKAPLRQSLDALTASRTERERQKLRKELQDEIRAAQRPPAQQTAAGPDPVSLYIAQAQLELKGYALARGIDWSAIPAPDLLFRPNETIDAAAARVRGVIDALSAEDGATERVATRRQAVGAGTPSRTGAGTSTADLLARVEREGIPLTDAAARKRAAQQLGIELPY